MTRKKNTKMLRLIASALILIVGVSSCKNKQKMSEISDKDEIEEQIAKEEITIVDEADDQPERNVVKSASTESRLTNYFNSISKASSVSSANGSIAEALTMFSSKDAPVLIVFYEANGTPSYDEPTTIEKYLHYLKDTQNFNTYIEETVMDSGGKIK